MKGFSRKKLRAARQAKGLTLVEAAKALGCSKGTVFNWEAGRTTPAARHEEAVAAFLGVEASKPKPKPVAAAQRLPAGELPPGPPLPAQAEVLAGSAQGAAQVAATYVATHPGLSPEQVLKLVRDLRHALS